MTGNRSAVCSFLLQKIKTLCLLAKFNPALVHGMAHTLATGVLMTHRKRLIIHPNTLSQRRWNCRDPAYCPELGNGSETIPPRSLFVLIFVSNGPQKYCTKLIYVEHRFPLPPSIQALAGKSVQSVHFICLGTAQYALICNANLMEKVVAKNECLIVFNGCTMMHK